MSPRLRALLFALLLLVPAPGSAQTSPASVGPVPAGPGKITGQVVHPGGPPRAAGADVVLYAIAQDGAPGVARTSADAEGRFAFEGVDTGPDVVYLLGARYDSVPFVGERVVFAPGETERAVSIAIAERTRDASVVAPEESTLRLERVGAEIVATEVIRLRNGSDRAFYVTPEEREAGASPAFRAELPEGFTRFSLPYAIAPEGVIREGREVAFYGPIYAGTQELAFNWALPAEAGEFPLTRRFPSGAGRLSVLFPALGLDIATESLSPVEDQVIGGVAYRAFASDGVAPGTRIALALSVPETRIDAHAVELRHARAFLELDDAALAVREEYTLHVSGSTQVAAADGSPLLRIPIPAEARDVRFGATGYTASIAFEGGALNVRGPMPAGESRLNVRYRLPASRGTTRWDWHFGAPTPLAEVYIADTAIEVVSTRLHRRRPVRTPQERNFLHFEAFRMDAGEIIDVALTPQAARLAPGRTLRTGVLLLTALAAAAFLTAPFLHREPVDARDSEPVSNARREREGVYQAIHDLDHDFETGKVAESDYQEMRSDLRHRAALLVGAERAAAAAAEPPAPSCAACGAPHEADARFCSRCGANLAGSARDGTAG